MIRATGVAHSIGVAIEGRFLEIAGLDADGKTIHHGHAGHQGRSQRRFGMLIISGSALMLVARLRSDGRPRSPR